MYDERTQQPRLASVCEGCARQSFSPDGALFAGNVPDDILRSTSPARVVRIHVTDEISKPAADTVSVAASHGASKDRSNAGDSTSSLSSLPNVFSALRIKGPCVESSSARTVSNVVDSLAAIRSTLLAIHEADVAGFPDDGIVERAFVLPARLAAVKHALALANEMKFVLDATSSQIGVYRMTSSYQPIPFASDACTPAVTQNQQALFACLKKGLPVKGSSERDDAEAVGVNANDAAASAPIETDAGNHAPTLEAAEIPARTMTSTGTAPATQPAEDDSVVSQPLSELLEVDAALQPDNPDVDYVGMIVTPEQFQKFMPISGVTLSHDDRVSVSACKHESGLTLIIATKPVRVFMEPGYRAAFLTELFQETGRHLEPAITSPQYVSASRITYGKHNFLRALKNAGVPLLRCEFFGGRDRAQPLLRDLISIRSPITLDIGAAVRKHELGNAAAPAEVCLQVLELWKLPLSGAAGAPWYKNSATGVPLNDSNGSVTWENYPLFGALGLYRQGGITFKFVSKCGVLACYCNNSWCQGCSLLACGFYVQTVMCFKSEIPL